MPFNNRFQDVTIWTQNGLGDDGFPALNAPRVVKARWEDRIAELNTPAVGQTKTSNARVWFDEVFQTGDYMYNGISTDALPPETARRVIRTVTVPSVRADRYERFTYLD